MRNLTVVDIGRKKISGHFSKSTDHTVSLLLKKKTGNGESSKLPWFPCRFFFLSCPPPPSLQVFPFDRAKSTNSDDEPYALFSFFLLFFPFYFILYQLCCGLVELVARIDERKALYTVLAFKEGRLFLPGVT